jgi:uncharacterized protein YggU (UPF0235/DUF167 family)
LADVPWSQRGETLLLSVRLTPKSARDAIDGIIRLSDGKPVLQVRVRAVPEAGAANEALIRLLAKSLRVPARSIHLDSGATSRTKILSLTGDLAAIQAGLSRLTQSAASPPDG